MKKQNSTPRKQTLPETLPTLPADAPPHIAETNIPSYAVTPTPNTRAQANMVLDLPNTLTAHSLSTLSAHLAPDHPAVELEALNHKLLNILMEEGEQARLLRRQTQTMDAMFHVLVKHGFTASLPPNDKTHAAQMADYEDKLANPPPPDPKKPWQSTTPDKPTPPELTKAERELIALSLKTQRQCAQTVCGLGKLSYLERMMDYVQSRSADMPPHKR